MIGKVMRNISFIISMWFCLFTASVASSQQTAQNSSEESVSIVRMRSVQFVLSDIMTHRATMELEASDGGEWSVFIRAGVMKLNWEGTAERVAAAHDAQGEWTDLSGHLSAELLGWEGALGIRREQRFSNHVSMHTGAFIRFCQSSSLLEETVVEDADDANWFGATQPHPLDHEMRSSSMGAGIEWGLMWNMSEDLFLKAFIGPMFHLVNHNVVSAEEDEINVVNGSIERLRGAYDAPWELTNHYAAQTGPWMRSGITLGFEF